MNSIRYLAESHNRRDFLKTAFGTGAICLLGKAANARTNESHPTGERVGGGEQTSPGGVRRPNIVFLLADDLGYRDIGCYGGPVRTPALDNLAAQGVRCTDFYSGGAVCSPSRATLLTGRHHIRAGVYSWIDDYHHSAHLLEREVTLAKVLKGHGYQTAHLGKWHLGMPTHHRQKPTPANHGFDYWFATANNA